MSDSMIEAFLAMIQTLKPMTTADWPAWFEDERSHTSGFVGLFSVYNIPHMVYESTVSKEAQDVAVSLCPLTPNLIWGPGLGTRVHVPAVRTRLGLVDDLRINKLDWEHAKRNGTPHTLVATRCQDVLSQHAQNTLQAVRTLAQFRALALHARLRSAVEQRRQHYRLVADARLEVEGVNKISYQLISKRASRQHPKPDLKGMLSDMYVIPHALTANDDRPFSCFGLRSFNREPIVLPPASDSAHHRLQALLSVRRAFSTIGIDIQHWL